MADSSLFNDTSNLEALKSLQSQLEEQVHILDAFFELSIDLFMISKGDYIVKANPAWTYTLGWTLDEVYSRPIWDFIHPDDRGPSQQFKGAFLYDHDPTHRLRHRWLCKNGDYVTVEWQAVRNGEERVAFAVGRVLNGSTVDQRQPSLAHE